MFVDHPKGPDTVLVGAQRWDVDAGKEGCSTRVLAWEAHDLELLAGALLLFQVHDPPDIAFRTRLDGEDVA